MDPADVIRILVATDNHLGYAEKDPERSYDSFIAFEECLNLAVSENVDFILLGGDLFHDAVPTQNATNICMKLIRQYTQGDKPVDVELLSDPKLNFHNPPSGTVNYEDPNINISIPIFSIHGNHDDPSSFGRLSTLDLLSTNGLINYFGRWKDLTKIDIYPVLLRKGETKLALYGLSHLHDNRLARLFEQLKVTMRRPSEESAEEWFHLMVLHQNRADRGLKNYIPEEVLPDFLNFVIWGHEHDCRIEPEFNHYKDFYVCQPGSSVATSLSEGESIPKHCGLLEIHKDKFHMTPLPLQTVRPFIFESVNVSEISGELDLNGKDDSEKIKAMATEKIESMIERAKTLLTGHPKQPKLPLIRLRIIYESDEQTFNAIRFGQMFNTKVANPEDVILFKKQAKVRVKKADGIDFDDTDIRPLNANINANAEILEMIKERFEKDDGESTLKMMPTSAFCEVFMRTIERHDPNALEDVWNCYTKKALNHLMDKLPNDDALNMELKELQQSLTQEDLIKLLEDQDIKSENEKVQKPASKQESNSEDSEEATSPAKSTRSGAASKEKVVDLTHAADSSAKKRTTAATRGRGARGGRGRGTTKQTLLTMPKLDLSVGTRTSNRSVQQKKSFYVISDDSD